MKTKKIINLIAVAGFSLLSLVGCNSGGASASNPNVNPTNASVSSVSDTSISVTNGGTQTFLNPIISQLANLAGKDLGDVVGELSTDLAVNLLNSMGITFFNSPADAQDIQIEGQLNQIESQLTTINSTLNTFVNDYYKNQSVSSTEWFETINGDIYIDYTNLAQDIYAGYPDSDSYTGLWESGIIPSIPPESAVLIAPATQRVYSAYSSFPQLLNTQITQLSDDGDSSYMDGNGNLLISQNSDGSWNSSRVNSVAPGTGWFAQNLTNAFNDFNLQNPAYGQNNFNSNENLFMNSQQWTQIVKTALFYNDVGLQQAYQILDSLLRIKYLSGNQDLASIALPPFMGAPSNYQNYEQAHAALFKIFEYKEYIIYTEAQQAINQYSTGPSGSQLSDFTIPNGCDNINEINYEWLQNNPNSYNWNGKILTTQCTNTNTGIKAYTAQDIGDMCNLGTLANVGGNLYCGSYTPSTYFSGQGGELANVVNNDMAMDYSSAWTQDHLNIRGFNLSTPTSDFGGGEYFSLSEQNGTYGIQDGFQASNFMRLTDQYHVYDVGYGPNPNRSDDGVDMYIYITCIRYDLTCHSVNNSGDSDGPTGYSGISLLYSNGINTNQAASNEPNITLNGSDSDEYQYNSYHMYYPSTW